ncbi:GDH/6PGL endoplasmic bifunctional protein [Brienomyrus brachyistius]|uniref:GDH/6PGL endoplasmic bifunctional protein n=1 Tax=Brienomyrus brachyistius TaxID=42636 RepID=UPI0020B1F7C9|nr:GDH/6PGL endoplasmic bifunctional protein [Brienomyrus brachyistius]
MMWRALFTFLLLDSVCTQKGSSKESKGHVSVVIVGGTGDLARKYLWQSFFQLYADQVSSGYSFSFYGGGLSEAAKGKPKFFQILKSLACSSEVSEERCALLKEQFLKLAQYQQLNTTEDYENLAGDIRQRLENEELAEAGRLFYLAVPASTYADIAEKISRSCRPGQGQWLRVALEKPFGHDLDSAEQLATLLKKSLHEDEMFRIDHYLGKQVVSQILPFRKDNKNFLDPIWNKHHIERMEIVLKETLDVKGRAQFYDQYGVIRDVLQNHLTEILLLLTMGVPANMSNSDEIVNKKLQVFSSLKDIDRTSAVIGQYQAYNSEVQEELNRTKEHISNTPTFAGVVVLVRNTQFDGVPIFLTSGKMLDEQVAYARILFKNEVFSVRNSSSLRCSPKQIVFLLRHGILQRSAILVSKNLFKPTVSDDGWKEVTGERDTALFGLPLSGYYIYMPTFQREAYESVVSQIFHGRKDSIIRVETMLASWAFWTPLLHSLAQQAPRIYPGGTDTENLLDFQRQGRKIAFTNEAVILSSRDFVGGSATAENFQVMRGKYRDSDMVSAWPEELIDRLAADLQAAAEEAVEGGGVFHLALSGGSSPVALFQRLAVHHYSFPWQQTHIWMVDERCVPLSEPGSNFHALHENLLQHVRLPYFNIHPMPVHLNRRLCVEEDGGPLLYENDISRLVNGSSFHFVLLGVGYDGHTASLFQSTQLDTHAYKLVVLTESPAKPHQRMSLTLAAINQAQRVGVLVTGKSKHEMIIQLSRIKDDPQKWPITGVRPTGGKLVWYIDYDALLG